MALSLSSYDRCSNPLIIFVLIIFVGVCCTPSCVSMFLLYWIIRTQPSTQVWTHQGWAEGKAVFPQLAGNTHNNALGSCWDFFFFFFFLQWHTAGSYSASHMSGPCLKSFWPVSPSPSWHVGLFFPIYRTLFPFDELHEVPVSPFLHPFEVPLNGSTTIWSSRWSSLLCVICKFPKGAVCPIIQVMSLLKSW